MPNFSLLTGSLQCRYFNGTVHHDLFHNKIVFNVSIRTLTSIPSMCHQFYKKPKLCTLAALTRCFGKRIKWKFLHQNVPEKVHQFWQLRQSLCRNQFLWQLRWWGWVRVCSVELQTKVHTKVRNHIEVPTRAFSWLKAATTAFTFKNLLKDTMLNEHWPHGK